MKRPSDTFINEAVDYFETVSTENGDTFSGSMVLLLLELKQKRAEQKQREVANAAK